MSNSIIFSEDLNSIFKIELEWKAQTDKETNKFLLFQGKNNKIS